MNALRLIHACMKHYKFPYDHVHVHADLKGFSRAVLTIAPACINCNSLSDTEKICKVHVHKR